MSYHFYAHPAQKVDEVPDVQDFRNVVNPHRLRRQKHGADYLEGFVLCSLRGDFSGQLVPAFYYKPCHNSQIYIFLRKGGCVPLAFISAPISFTEGREGASRVCIICLSFYSTLPAEEKKNLLRTSILICTTLPLDCTGSLCSRKTHHNH